MFDNWANDPRVTRFLTWPPHQSPAVTKGLLESWCALYEQKDFYLWAITLAGTPIGSISVVKNNPQSDCVELGYCIGYLYWNKRLMTEALQAVIDYLFEQVGLHRIENWHAVQNPASGRVAQNCGLTHEGIRREDFKTLDGVYLDIAEYGILHREWAAKKT